MLTVDVVRRVWTLVCTVVLAVTGCTSQAPPPLGASQLAGTPSVSAAVAQSHVDRPPAQPGYRGRPEGTVVGGQPLTYVATARGGTIGLLWLDAARLHFRYVPGRLYPERGPILAVDRVPSTWTGRMVAAFNGAFKLSDGVGGYYYAGTTVSRLRAGLASLVIDSSGRLSVLVWGKAPIVLHGLQVVRQNLPPLVDQSRAQTSPSDSNHTWGWADHGNRLANRSALAEMSDHSLVYVYGHQLTAADMAAVIVRLHAVTAIMLDMNLSQPGGFVYAHQGSAVLGRRILPTIYHNPSVYQSWYKKDFVVASPRP